MFLILKTLEELNRINLSLTMKWLRNIETRMSCRNHWEAQLAKRHSPNSPSTTVERNRSSNKNHWPKHRFKVYIFNILTAVRLPMADLCTKLCKVCIMCGYYSFGNSVLCTLVRQLEKTCEPKIINNKITTWNVAHFYRMATG